MSHFMIVFIFFKHSLENKMFIFEEYVVFNHVSSLFVIV